MTDWEETFQDFTEEMKAKIVKRMPELGLMWRDMSKATLVRILRTHIFSEDWSSVANLAYMLRENERTENERKKD